MRLDQEMVKRGLVQSRSQAQRLIKLEKVEVNGKLAKKPNMTTSSSAGIDLMGEKFVSRAGLKLASVSEKLGLDFQAKNVLDVGSSTGGFTDYALQNGAKHVTAVDVGTQQLHPTLRNDKRIELHEKTDIRNFRTTAKLDVVLIDVSFISLREILPHILKLVDDNTEVVAMLKPQFEVGEKLKNKGVVKNDTMRRQILKDFERWVKQKFLIIAKADSEISGSKGNVERFYLLKTIR